MATPEYLRKAEIGAAIERERDYQNRKHGTIEDHPHTVGEWILIMEVELAEAKLAWAKSRGDVPALREMLQVVATGVACFEQHGVFERVVDNT